MFKISIENVWQKIRCVSLKRELCALAIVSVAFFIGLALLSYCPYDVSWFFYSTDSSHAIKNMCGPVGAQVAAFLIYVCGAASLGFIGMLLFMAYLILARREWAQEWERIAAWVVLVVMGATACALYDIDFLKNQYPGGYVGGHLYAVAYQWFDHVGAKLFVYTFLYASMVVLFRFSCMGFVSTVIHGVRTGGWLMYEYRVVQRACVGLYRACVCAVRPLVWAQNFIAQLYSGSLFVGTELMGADEFFSAQDDYVNGDHINGDYINGDQVFDSHVKSAHDWGGQGLQKTLNSHDSAYDCPATFLQELQNQDDILTQDLFWLPEDELANIKYTGAKEDRPEKRGSMRGHQSMQAGGTLSAAQQELHHTNQSKDGGAQAEKVGAQKGSVSGQEIIGSDTQESTHQNKYKLPNLAIFVGVDHERNDEALKAELQTRAETLQEKLQRFGIEGEVVSIKRGPVVTLFEYKPGIDIKLSKILALEDDLAMALRAHGIRILAPIPGKAVVGFEVANANRIDVMFADTVKSPEYCQKERALPLVLGQDTIGNQVVVDLARMPHLLIAGSTGSGKSVALNAMLVSLLCSCTPDELKLILIDPKRLEFGTYADIAHLLFPIVTDMKQVSPILRWVVQQMETRYERMATCGVRNIADYNKLVKKDAAYEHMPFIVVVIDELADLMMTVGKEVEDLIARIAQMARAAGIHLLVATQRPSVDVITGLIKVNFPSRISFRVTSRVDSRTILDCMGADKLLGRGDMLFLDSTHSVLKRVHGAYVSDSEIEQIVSHIRAERAPEYLDIKQELQQDSSAMDTDQQQLYDQVIEFLQEVDAVSISLLQRTFKIGYNRSAGVIEMLEAQGLIMPASGGKTRRVIK